MNHKIKNDITLFCNYVEQLKKSLVRYNKYYYRKRFSFILANGDKIQLFFTKHIVAHFLGLQYTYLVEHPLFENLTAYQGLEYIIQNPNIIIKEIESGNLNVREMFSPKFERKNLAIERTPILDYSILNHIAFVCPYNQNLHCEFTKHPIQSDYMVGIRNQENDMSLFGIVANKQDGKFYINSNLLVLNDQNYFKELKEFIGNQVLTYASCCQVYDYNEDVSTSRLVFLNEQEKLTKLQQLKYYQDKLNSMIDTTAETERQLSEIIKMKEMRGNSLEFIAFLKRKMQNGEEISIDECQNFDKKYFELASLTNQLLRKLNLLEPFAEAVLESSHIYEKKKKGF